MIVCIITTREDEHRLRPFHHARLVVTDFGQHLDGEPLDEHSTGCVFDRYGSKEYTEEGKRTKSLDSWRG
jgi:hypothetical protein